MTPVPVVIVINEGKMESKSEGQRAGQDWELRYGCDTTVKLSTPNLYF
jgi:hypothetical protein